VFWNLCLNALQAMWRGGELQVPRAREAGCPGPVSDAVHGIHAADLRHIFEPFFSTKSEGSGIGLARSTVSCRNTAATSMFGATPGRNHLHDHTTAGDA